MEVGQDTGNATAHDQLLLLAKRWGKAGDGASVVSGVNGGWCRSRERRKKVGRERVRKNSKQ
jgi:hypothetical protein